MAAADTIAYTDANFSGLTSSGVALVDLYADWCGPCKIMAPTIDKLAVAFKDRAKVGKLNVDDNPATAGGLGVSSIPTVVIFKDGQEVARFVGVKSESDLTRALEEHL
jgi:thioredoxin 1